MNQIPPRYSELYTYYANYYAQYCAENNIELDEAAQVAYANEHATAAYHAELEKEAAEAEPSGESVTANPQPQVKATKNKENKVSKKRIAIISGAAVAVLALVAGFFFVFPMIFGGKGNANNRIRDYAKAPDLELSVNYSYGYVDSQYYRGLVYGQAKDDTLIVYPDFDYQWWDYSRPGNPKSVYTWYPDFEKHYDAAYEMVEEYTKRKQGDSSFCWFVCEYSYWSEMDQYEYTDEDPEPTVEEYWDRLETGQDYADRNKPAFLTDNGGYTAAFRDKFEGQYRGFSIPQEPVETPVEYVLKGIDLNNAEELWAFDLSAFTEFRDGIGTGVEAHPESPIAIISVTDFSESFRNNGTDFYLVDTVSGELMDSISANPKEVHSYLLTDRGIVVYEGTSLYLKKYNDIYSDPVWSLETGDDESSVYIVDSNLLLLNTSDDYYEVVRIDTGEVTVLTGRVEGDPYFFHEVDDGFIAVSRVDSSGYLYDVTKINYGGGQLKESGFSHVGIVDNNFFGMRDDEFGLLNLKDLSPVWTINFDSGDYLLAIQSGMLLIGGDSKIQYRSLSNGEVLDKPSPVIDGARVYLGESMFYRIDDESLAAYDYGSDEFRWNMKLENREVVRLGDRLLLVSKSLTDDRVLGEIYILN